MIVSTGRDDDERRLRLLTRSHYERFPFVAGGDVRERHWKRRIRRHLPDLAGATLLDVGCGSGDIARMFNAGDARVVGVDLTWAAASRAYGRAIETIQADALHLPLRTASVDHSVAIGVLHHTPDCRRALAEMSRVTVSGGRIVVMLYARNTPYHLGYLIARPLRRRVPLSTMDRLPRLLLAFARFVICLQVGQRMGDTNIKGLIADQFWTPRATFHGPAQVLGWAKELGLCPVARRRLLCHANIFVFEKA